MVNFLATKLNFVKVHRHHLDLPWPLKSEGVLNKPYLCTKTVHIDSYKLQNEIDEFPITGQLSVIKQLHSQTFQSIHKLPWGCDKT